ncbi:MAG TPA: prepilin-type N-terminal cleavage/methylation domain-containing protein [Euzebyales bacterium]|nr:prepilin-type N-terminal cleavage/methylation domain-containing protein [Euzebyales bacterium]
MRRRGPVRAGLACRPGLALRPGLARRLRDEGGVTLVELLVTMSILSVVMLLITGSAIFLQRTMRLTEQRFDDLAQARLAMDATTLWLRGAVTIERDDTGAADRDPFTQAMRWRVDFISNVRTTTASGNPAPQRVRLEVTTNGELEETVWSGRLNPNGHWTQFGQPQRRIVARGVIEDQPFTFFDEAGNEITPDSSGNLSQAGREAIRYVGVNVVVQQDAGAGVPASQLRNRVRLPNQFYYDLQETS